MTPVAADRRTRPNCPACRRPVEHAAFQSNYCVSFVAAGYVRAHPHSTAWEIARGSGLEYERVAAAMPKARDLNLVSVDSDEDLGAGRRRYRFVAANRPDNYRELEARHREAVARGTR